MFLKNSRSEFENVYGTFVTEHDEHIREIKNKHFSIRWNLYTNTVKIEKSYMQNLATKEYAYSKNFDPCTLEEGKILAMMLVKILQME